MNRRKFIYTSVVGIMALIALAVPSFAGSKKRLGKIIIRDLGLPVQLEEVIKFLDAAEKENTWIFRSKNKLMLVKACYYLGWLPGFPYREATVEFQKNLTTVFLISTNFFHNKMDQTRPISFIGIYDPYRRPCRHPLAVIG